MHNDWGYDIETFPNVFTLTIAHCVAPIRVSYQISDYRNDSHDICHFVRYLRNSGARMVGFNNIGFDYPVLHQLLTMGKSDALSLYRKAMAIIESSNGDNRWLHQVKQSDYLVPQVDLFKIHHFDNRAKSTSLKSLEFVMRSDSIQELPFKPGTLLDRSQIDVLLDYNAHDVDQTIKFYHASQAMIEFRDTLNQTFAVDCTNFNDTKIGTEFFISRLEQSGIHCYEYTNGARKPRQTPRASIKLSDAIRPITFNSPEFNKIQSWLLSQEIIETKGVFKGLSATVNGFEFVFGQGGIHGSLVNRRLQSTTGHRIIDLDVTSYYPMLAIANGFYPEHLGPVFGKVYKELFDERARYEKGSSQNAALKLGLNGTYGNSNNPYSVFYDPLYTMRITLNGQLLLCLLAERLMSVTGVQLIQVNTDGLTALVPVEKESEFMGEADNWSRATRLTLERADYALMIVRDVNSYIAVTNDGKVKRKGAYQYKLDWHQNHSALVVPKVAEMVLVYGKSIKDTVESWPDPMDFMLCVKVPRSSELHLVTTTGHELLQNTTRYYVSEGGGNLYKMMPPLKDKTEPRRIGINAGRTVTICNRGVSMTNPIDYGFYIHEVEKLCLQIM